MKKGEYYQVSQARSYNDRCGSNEITYDTKDFAKLEDAELYLAEQLKSFQYLADHIAKCSKNYEHCEYEADVLVAVEHDNDYVDYRPELIVKPLY